MTGAVDNRFVWPSLETETNAPGLGIGQLKSTNEVSFGGCFSVSAFLLPYREE